jgi:hypothetical protein
MQSVYVIIENGEPYETAYTSYRYAVSEVIHRHWEQIKEEDILAEVDIAEHKSGITYIYIEKGLNIYIYKLPVKQTSC